MKGVSRKPRTVGLDKPCRVCGQPIHFTYSGPVEGVCGRCVDERKRRSTASIVVIVCVVMVVGAVAVAAALKVLLG